MLKEAECKVLTKQSMQEMMQWRHEYLIKNAEEDFDKRFEDDQPSGRILRSLKSLDLRSLDLSDIAQ